MGLRCSPLTIFSSTPELTRANALRRLRWPASGLALSWDGASSRGESRIGEGPPYAEPRGCVIGDCLTQPRLHFNRSCNSTRLPHRTLERNLSVTKRAHRRRSDGTL